MRHTTNKINGLAVMVFSIIGITLVSTSFYVIAAPSAKLPAQPKIASIKILNKTPGAQITRSLNWPAEAGKIIELDSAVSAIQLTPAVQKGYSARTYWAFRYVWSDSAPDIATLVDDGKSLAAQNFKANSFATRAISPLIPTNQKQNQGRYLTIYSFATNKDKTTVLAGYPFGIDYVAAVTYHVPGENTAEPTEIKTVESQPVPVNDDWSQINDTKPGYRE